jgi:DNA-binding winged helix-turn-helix (wHTH) protein
VKRVIDLALIGGDMAAPNHVPTAVRFGNFEVYPDSQELHKNGVRLKVSGQAIQVLLVLLDVPGRLVTREELQQRLWPGASFGDFDHGLNAAVNRLRDVLFDSATQPKFIETVPRRGYRFIAQTAQVHQSTGAFIPVRFVRQGIILSAILGMCLLVVGDSVHGRRIDQTSTINQTNVGRPSDEGSDSTLVSYNPDERVGLKYFSGTWKNTDAATRGITTVSIRTQGNLVWVHLWGQCLPNDCDLGEVPADAFGPDVSADVARNAQVVVAHFNFPFVEMTTTLRPSGVDILEAETLNRFTDRSGRSNASLGSTFSREVPANTR